VAEVAKKKTTVQQTQETLKRQGIAIVKSDDGLLYLRDQPGKSAPVKFYLHGGGIPMVEYLLSQRPENVECEELAKAVRFLEIAALNAPARERISVRYAERNGELYVNLCDGTGRVVHVTREGWEVKPNPGVGFWTPSNAQAIPEPLKSGGDLSELNSILGLSDHDWTLVEGLILGAVKEEGAHFAGVFQGDPGGGKTTLANALLTVLDPTAKMASDQSGIRLPTKPDDMLAVFNGGWLLSFEEVSKLFPAQLDWLKTLVTGGTWMVRLLYTNGQSYSVSGRRQIFLNGSFGNLLADDALRDRAIPLWLSRVEKSRLQSGTELAKNIATALPRIWGGLLDMMVNGLRQTDSGIPTERKLRMYDAVEWICRCLKGSGRDPVKFLGALDAAKRTTTTVAVADWVVRPALEEVAKRGFVGLPTALFAEVEASPLARRSKADWPNGVTQFSAQLNSRISELESIGIVVKRSKINGDNRIQVSFVDPPKSVPTAAVTLAAPPQPVQVKPRGVIAEASELHAVMPDLLVFCTYSDESVQVFGRHAEEVASILNRRTDPGPHITLAKEEWDSVIGELNFQGLAQL
jgi:hypothetical protein